MSEWESQALVSYSGPVRTNWQRLDLCMNEVPEVRSLVYVTCEDTGDGIRLVIPCIDTYPSCSPTLQKVRSLLSILFRPFDIVHPV